ncbi:efflux RND transporter periplasmic adaptor subunit [Massilia sp. LXY-6]|uniref:efflux RND transporter periplasmic adaptor subunit n=1 Tax=Massilia sp. LXY-6 TaxID=3379823 RepID=UPI003EE1CC6C
MMKTRTLLAPLALALLAAGLGWYAMRPAAKAVPPARTQAAPRAGQDQLFSLPDASTQLSFLRIVQVGAQALPVAEPVAGRIAYDENLTSRIASPVQGRVTAQRVEVGDSVRAGQLLAELDSPDLAGAQADERKAAADEERKRLALARTRMLVDADVLARKDFENAQADYRQADAEARRARQRIGNLHAHGKVDGRFGLRAPIAGVVADRQLNIGQEVRPDQANPLLVISDLRHVWAIADVPEGVAAGLRPGQPVLVETEAFPGRTFRGRIGRIGVALDPVTRRVQVRCELDNPDGRLRPDMFARIAFVAADGKAEAVPVPNTALVTEGLYTYVFVERGHGSFEKRRVRVALGGAARSYVDAGLHSNELVVTEGALLLNAEASNHAG